MATIAALNLIITGAISVSGPPISTPVDFGQVALSIGMATVALAIWAGLTFK